METTPQKLDAIPHSAGIYIYRNQEKEILYVGKAVNLNRRVRQYFTGGSAIGAKTNLLVSQIQTIETRETPTEFDALLLEALLIRLYEPKYNSISKDDKSPLYIVLTMDDTLPSVRLVRKSWLDREKKKEWRIIGPFQSGRIAKDLLRTLRHIIPFCLQKTRTGKPCFYTHLGLCRPCPSYIAHLSDGKEKTELTKQYRRNIRLLRDILTGKQNNVYRLFQNQMRHYARQNNFEQAGRIRQYLLAFESLTHTHFDPSVFGIGETFGRDIREEETVSLEKVLKPYYPQISRILRVECLDISHLSGSSTTASLVVMENGIPDTSQYRRFKIQKLSGANDVSSITETLTRRLTHPDWTFPDLFIIDGGKPQLEAARRVLLNNNISIPVIGIAKRLEEIVLKDQSDTFVSVQLLLTDPALHFIQRIRDEAHRFAKSYHVLLRKKNFLHN